MRQKRPKVKVFHNGPEDGIRERWSGAGSPPKSIEMNLTDEYYKYGLKTISRESRAIYYHYKLIEYKEKDEKDSTEDKAMGS